MFTCSISFSGPTSPDKFSINYSDKAEISFSHINHKYLSGGYYLHRYLPYQDRDIYYSDGTRDISVLFSGSVYNSTELRDSLKIKAGIPDPELVANLFLSYGPGFVEKLNGDFAISIILPEKKEAYLFRDHLGVKPLAWCLERETLYISTDINGLCRDLSDGKAIDSEFLLGYFKYIDYKKTPDSRIKKLPPAHYLRFSVNGVKIKKYWDPGSIKIDRKLTYQRMISDLKDLVRDAVSIRCDSRFKAGAHVSSGLDSGLVSILARKNYGHQEIFYGFSWSPGNYSPQNIEYDERDLITGLCNETAIRPVFADMKEADFSRYICDFYYNGGYFFENKTAEQAAALSTNLIFSGWGGDEFISTGHSGIDLDLLKGLKLRAFFQRNPINKFRKFIKSVIFYVIFPLLGILPRSTVRAFKKDSRYLMNPYKKSDNKALRYFFFHRSRREMHLNTLRFYNLPERCENWHMIGFLNGIVYRYPLLDKRIIEYMLRVPSELLSKSDTYRPVLRELGKEILTEEIRLNQGKNDPVWWSWFKYLFKEVSYSLVHEVETWEGNADLNFIDFDLLKNDIDKYKKEVETMDTTGLFRSIVFIKAIHEFTVAYRRGKKNPEKKSKPG